MRIIAILKRRIRNRCKDAHMNAITENFSKKRNRDRPCTIFSDPDDKREWMRLHDDVRSERSIVNRAYYWDALMALGEGHEVEFVWLADAKADRFKHTILTELERIKDSEEIRDLAAFICEYKMRTSEAVCFIRDCRGVSKPASAERLEKVLRTRIDRWLDASGTPEQIVDVLRRLITDVECDMQPDARIAAGNSSATGASRDSCHL